MQPPSSGEASYVPGALSPVSPRSRTYCYWDMTGFPSNQIHFYSTVLKLPWNEVYISDLLAVLAFRLLSYAAAILLHTGNCSILCSHAESSLAHRHGTRIQLRSLLNAVSLCVTLSTVAREEKKIRSLFFFCSHSDAMHVITLLPK